MPGVSVDDEDVFFSIGGGYNFNKMFAVEAGYTDLGEAEISVPGFYTATISTDGFYFGPRLTLELSPQFEAYGRIGLLAWDAEFNDSDGFLCKR
jgi:OOP family OmpA-OmpF porin